MTTTAGTSALATRGSTRQPLESLVASARRLTRKSLAARAGSSGKSWQDDAWEMFDLVGELRFLAVTLAGRMSQAKLYVGKLTDNAQDAPEPVEDEELTSILEGIGASPSARAQLIARLGVNLFVPGDGWLAGIPRHLIPEALLVGGSLSVNPEMPLPEPPEGAEPGTLSIEDLEWRMLSVSEVSANAGGGEVQIRLGETEDEMIRVNPDHIFLIRVWRPHPRKWWEADSPVRSSLPVLRELVGLTMHVSAEVDSRLAGAGLLIIPQSAQRALQLAAGLTETDAPQDVFTEALMEAMLTPVVDRANASALVPLVVTVPDEAVERFKYMDFSKPIDQFSGERRDEAIRRLALGLDAPPELLLGTGGMNHWGAWLVQEDVVTTHLEPPLALICDALTTQYLWPVLIDQGMGEADARQYVIWYDVSDLVVRPNRSVDALALHERGVINDEALRKATGFDEADAPAQLPPAMSIALSACTSNPSLFGNPGIAVMVEQISAVLEGRQPPPLPTPPGQAAAPEATPADEPAAPARQDMPAAVPDTRSAPASVPSPEPIAASAAPATAQIPVVIDDLAPTEILKPVGPAWDEVLAAQGLAVPRRVRT